MKDYRIGDEKLLVARSNKGHWKICGGLVSENEKSNRGTSRKVIMNEVLEKNINIFNSRLYH